MVAFSKIACTALAIGAASAHTIFQQVWVNGVAQGHIVGLRVPSYDGPINDVTSNDIICNGGPNPLNKPYSQTIIQVPAGASITMEWHHTLDGANPSDSADPVDPGHKGPIMAYLAAVPSALQDSVTGLKWFKVYEDGWDPATNVWAVDKLYAAKGLVTFKLPDCIPSGNYFLRGELIALHGAGSNLGAQFYMECAQINIVGGGSASPPTVSFPGAYKQNDPGVLVNIYYPPLPSYVIPGPRPFTCGASNPTTAATTKSSTLATVTTRSTTTAPTTRATTTAATTTRSTTTTTKPTTTAATTGSTGGTAAAWAQCGGIGFTGPTACVSGYKCTVQSAYYSQCVPA
ncbi:Endoglucanase-4 [Dactylellina cionopaga]|nr:Endoglucanase-4 [Dactylellina cionopaga]